MSKNVWIIIQQLNTLSVNTVTSYLNIVNEFENDLLFQYLCAQYKHSIRCYYRRFQWYNTPKKKTHRKPPTEIIIIIIIYSKMYVVHCVCVRGGH